MQLPFFVKNGAKFKQFFIAITVNIAFFAAGCHTGWAAPSLPKLLSEEFPFEVSNTEASYITVIGYVGNACGGLLGTLLFDQIGRKKTILLIALPQLISFTLIIYSYHLMELLYVARCVGGFAEGVSYTVISVYIAEIAQPDIRGALNSFISLTLMSGMLYINIIGSFLSIRAAAMTVLVFPLLFLLSFWRMPESPYFLLMIGDQEKARRSLQFLRNQSDVSDEVATLMNVVKRQMSESGTYKDIFWIKSNRRAFIAVAGARIVQAGTGIYAFFSYMQLLISEATDLVPAYLGASVVLLVQLVATCLASCVVDTWGRRPLMLLSTSGCCLDLLIQAVYFALKEYTGVNMSSINWFPLVMMSAFFLLFSMGLALSVNILISEIFPTSVKGKCAFLVNVIYAFAILASIKFYQTTADSFGLTVPYCSFGLTSALGVLFIYFFIPETKGRTLEEIQQDLKR